MWYVALVMRLAIVGIWIFMMVQNPVPQTPPFCSGLAFVLIWAYLGLTAVAWPKAMLCPFKKCDSCSSVKK